MEEDCLSVSGRLFQIHQTVPDTSHLFIACLQVCRMSNKTVETAISSHKHKPSKSAATNAMLLSVSFYVIFTTLPATLVYVLQTAFPEGNACLADPESDPTWRRYVVYFTTRKVRSGFKGNWNQILACSLAPYIMAQY